MSSYRPCIADCRFQPPLHLPGGSAKEGARAICEQIFVRRSYVATGWLGYFHKAELAVGEFGRPRAPAGVGEPGKLFFGCVANAVLHPRFAIGLFPEIPLIARCTAGLSHAFAGI